MDADCEIVWGVTRLEVVREQSGVVKPVRLLLIYSIFHVIVVL